MLIVIETGYGRIGIPTSLFFQCLCLAMASHFFQFECLHIPVCLYRLWCMRVPPPLTRDKLHVNAFERKVHVNETECSHPSKYRLTMTPPTHLTDMGRLTITETGTEGTGTDRDTNTYFGRYDDPHAHGDDSKRDRK